MNTIATNCATTLSLINFCERLALPRFSIFVRPKRSTKATERTEIVIIIFKNPVIVITIIILANIITEISNFKVYPTQN